MKPVLPIALAALLSSGPLFAQTQVLFSEDFNSPTGYSDPDQLSWTYAFVNGLFGTAFQNTHDVETLQIAGSAKFTDPSGIGGAYALGMLSDREPDLLAAVFDVGESGFLNVQIDISSIDFDCCGGPFNPNGDIPVFQLSLYDAPLGAFDVRSIGTPALDSDTITGIASEPLVFDWTNHIVALDASSSTDGNVALVIDLIEGGYAGFDNITVASSDERGAVSVASSSSGGGTGPIVLALLAAFAAIWRRRG
jgi:hypothetical protein